MQNISNEYYKMLKKNLKKTHYTKQIYPKISMQHKKSSFN